MAEAILTKNAYPHDSRADKDSYPHDRNATVNLCSFMNFVLHLS